MDIIHTENLNFSYKNQQVLDSLNLHVPDNAIYGYLGKNGAGKSTTIKLLLGLLDASKDSVFFEGKEFNNNRIEILENVGNLIEAPSYYSNLTATENLTYLNLIFKREKNRIAEVLQLVDLSGVKDKKVKHFSTGMKQRLGIAMAMFHDPKILILDEPLNGLDPEGIHGMRTLIVKLHSEGKTIFLSSHILSELDKICTHIGIINKGKLIYQGTKDSLLSNIERTVLLKVNDLPRAIKICEENNVNTLLFPDQTLSVQIENDKVFSELLRLLIENKIDIYSVDSQVSDLESVFLNLTSN